MGEVLSLGWLQAFYLEVLRELVIDVWVQHSVLRGHWGTQWVQAHSGFSNECAQAFYWLQNSPLFVLKQSNFYVWQALHVTQIHSEVGMEKCAYANTQTNTV